MIPKDQWEWFGSPGHFICARWCRFHLCTVIDKVVVSTVGELVHPRHSGGSEQAEDQWLKKNWPGEDIGAGRKYETMVFRLKGRCKAPDCDCGHPIIEPMELDADGYNTPGAALKGHRAMCEKWAKDEARREGGDR